MANEKNLTPFKKGQSGNLKGKPKGTKNRSTIARYWMEFEQDEKNPLSKEIERLTQEDLMTLAMLKKAKKGDVAAYRALFDSGYGSPKQSKDITSGGQPIAPPIVNVIMPKDPESE